MIKKLDRLLEKYQGNAYPAMYQDLGEHLGLTEKTIRDFALGWAPIVEFKKGKNYQGWWAIPERDSDANVVGISLRSQDDNKVMLPGSKHGLVYVVNPEHQQGEKGYSAGAQNWSRTMDAGVLCPVCEKPDGCLVSSENTLDPKAVICIREKSARPIRFGYLHVRKAAGHLRTASPLMASDHPVIIVEGFSDAAAATDLGFVAVGRPSNLACMDVLRDLVRSRPCIVVGENDQKSDGRWPGREGMIATFQSIRQVCRDVKMVLPPEGIKDLRAWKNKHGLTTQNFLAYIESKAETQVDTTVIADDRPTTIARAFLDDKYKMGSRYTLRRWEESWYEYAGTKYTLVKPEAFIQAFYPWAYDKLVQSETPKGDVTLKPLVANSSLMVNLSQAITAETLVASTAIPAWINGRQGPDPKDLIVFSNGVLDVSEFLAGSAEALSDSTPDLFTTAALPINFDPTATCPSWLSFLNSSLDDDPAKINLLQEFMGYTMTSDTSMQKMLFLRGVISSGKSTILEVLTNLVGHDQTCPISFTDLAGNHGTAPLMGKLLCTIGDARAPKDSSAMRGLELLLNISGNDGVQINRKFKDQITGHKLTARIAMASNEILDVPDHAGALARRLCLVEFNRSFASCPDNGLAERLKAETPGIALWALAGLRRLRENGAFTVPASTRDALAEWRLATSPVAAFLEECTDQGGEVGKTELYDAWVAWSSERRIGQVVKSKFFERVRSNAPHVNAATYEKGPHKISVFKGLTMKQWAIHKLLGKPGGR